MMTLKTSGKEFEKMINLGSFLTLGKSESFLSLHLTMHFLYFDFPT